MVEKSNCRKCPCYEKFESKIMKKTIHFCLSKGHRIYMIDSITECPEWQIHHGKKKRMSKNEFRHRKYG